MPIFELFLKLIVPANNQVPGINRFVVIQSSRNLSDTDLRTYFDLRWLTGGGSAAVKALKRR